MIETILIVYVISWQFIFGWIFTEILLRDHNHRDDFTWSTNKVDIAKIRSKYTVKKEL